MEMNQQDKHGEDAQRRLSPDASLKVYRKACDHAPLLHGAHKLRSWLDCRGKQEKADRMQ
jgi:hypothetical protein